MTEDEMTDIGAKVYRLCLNSAASHGDTDTDLEWIHTGEEVVRHSDYEIALKRILELEAQNALLLEDEKASPAIIAGYRDYNVRLIEQIRVRGECMNILWAYLGTAETPVEEFSQMCEWFDDNGKVRDEA